MTEKERVNLKRNKVAFLVGGIIFILLGLMFMIISFFMGLIILLIGCVCLKLSNVCKKGLLEGNKAQSEQKNNIIEPLSVFTTDTTPANKIDESEPVSEQELNRLKAMCEDIHGEYKQLLKEYSSSNTNGKVYILKECYRKLGVIDSTVGKHKCYYEIDIYDEYEKIEKKARSFINAYIKEQREDCNEDYMIDVTQFVSDLYFISDYIYEKDEKLNKM